MDEAGARAIFAWRYPPPYDIYNLDPGRMEEEMPVFLDRDNAYYCLYNRGGSLVAFCCFGPEARVPGGDYSPPALDVGLGMRPDLTGQGRGRAYARAVLDFAATTWAPPAFRVTVAEFNQRARRVWQELEFRLVARFARNRDGMPFVILAREAGTGPVQQDETGG
jgi:RimJ/RimL family protein N-acetyltransferase